MAQTSLNSTGVASSGALSLQSNGTTEAIGISTGQVATLAQNPILTSGTANGVAYLNGSKVLTTGSALTFDGTNLGLGVTPSTWASGSKAINVGAWGAVSSNTTSGNIELTNNAYQSSNAGVFTYVNTQAATRYAQALGNHQWYTAASGTAGNTITWTQAMTLDSTGLGIGTSSPQNKLVVSNSGAAGLEIHPTLRDFSTAGSFLLSYNRSGSAYVPIQYDASYHAWLTSNTERMRLDSSGNLGLGVTPSAWSTIKALQVGYSSLGTLTSNTYLNNNTYYNGTNWIYSTTAAAGKYQINDNVHSWHQAASGTAGDTISSFTQAMTLDASGNLMTGETSIVNPAGWSKGIQVYDTNYPYLSIKNSTRQYDLAGYGGSLYFWDATAGAARMVLDSSGNLLVGTTGITGYRLAVQMSGSTPVRIDRASNTGNLVDFSNGAGVLGNISTNSFSIAYNTTSDYRLKDNVQPLTGALARVAALKPCTYTWKAFPDETSEGFIAHELAEVCPHAVTGEKDAVNEDGTPKYQSIDTSFLVATLTAAIQELKAEFDAYKATHP